jgi:uncharacterized membrane protein YkoI
MARRVVFAIMLVQVLAAIPASAIFESDKTLAGQAKISMADAITVAERTIPGKPVHVEMGKDLGHTVYQVEILDKDNKSRWVYVDATNGAVTEAKRSSLPSVP